ncbi:MAG TPA: hypothetical protein VNJ09_11465, partial [Chthonomonadales bacterium]|nr:hypothetical protein [Chthonomonadales bacterium]
MKKLGRSKQQTGKMRLAVLPSAVDGSNKPCGESNFCDKLAVEIGASLAYLYSDQIGVIAHNVVSRYRGTTKSITQIGRELRADYLLDVSCWTAAAHSCIMVQLIHAKDETVLWAKGYDYAPGNPVPIQKDIGERVAQSVGLRLLPQRSTIRLEQESPRGDVLLLYQKGCYHQWEQSEESLRKSIECFERAVRLDPAYASAYAALA